IGTDGLVVATTLTAPDGSYHFDNLDLGAYVVREVVPTGVNLTTPAEHAVAITRGGMIDRQDFGELAPQLPPPPHGSPQPSKSGASSALSWLADGTDDPFGGPFVGRPRG